MGSAQNRRKIGPLRSSEIDPYDRPGALPRLTRVARIMQVASRPSPLTMPGNVTGSLVLAIACIISSTQPSAFHHSQAQVVVDGDGNLLLRAKAAFGGLDGGVAKQELDLLQVAAILAAEFRGVRRRSWVPKRSILIALAEVSTTLQPPNRSTHLPRHAQSIHKTTLLHSFPRSLRDIPSGNKTIAGRTHDAQLMFSILAPLHGPTIAVTSNQRPQIAVLIQLVSSLPFT